MNRKNKNHDCIWQEVTFYEQEKCAITWLCSKAKLHQKDLHAVANINLSLGIFISKDSPVLTEKLITLKQAS